MRRARLAVLICIAALVCGWLYYFYGGSKSPVGQGELVSLDIQNFDTLKRAFNEAQGAVRILALLSPT